MAWFRSVRLLRVVSVSRRGPRRVWQRRLLCVLTLAWIVAGFVPKNSSQASIETESPDVSFTTKDGMLTATFSEMTEDAELDAAIPALIARGVQAVSLRRAPVRNI